jgi:hypothetical protein
MPPFSVLISGDRRLSPAQFPFVRSRLEELFARRLPDVRVIVSSGNGADALAFRWAEERFLTIERWPRFRSEANTAAFIEWAMNLRPDAVVLFDGGDRELDELLRRAGVRGLPVRTVDVKAYVEVKH